LIEFENSFKDDENPDKKVIPRSDYDYDKMLFDTEKIKNS